MPRKRKPRTRLAVLRDTAGLTQPEMADRTGIPLRTLQRLESGAVENPPIRYLVNCAFVLGVELDDVLEPGMLRWTRLPGGPARPRSLEAWRMERVRKICRS
jgi:transcriptional regulator with XRE-family HTH domain